ncbi:MAG: hotdog fold thioesterase [Burkholderiaceae bacterium]|nr:hotdog fold thioesterase [Burkholderiaceae bacterium]
MTPFAPTGPPDMITAATQLLAIVGTPIGLVRSPENFNRWFAQAGVDMAMFPADVDAARLGAFVDLARGMRNLRGFIVTMPFKQAVARLVDELTPRAAAIGAVNAVRRDADGRLVGDIVDGLGFIAAARRHAFDPAGKRAALIGAGGVGTAIADALCEAGVAELALADADPARRQALAALLRARHPGVAITEGLNGLHNRDVFINATPVGTGGELAMSIDAAWLGEMPRGALVADVVTSPAITPLLARAFELGCRIQTGPEMSRAQVGTIGLFMGVMDDAQARAAGGPAPVSADVPTNPKDHLSELTPAARLLGREILSVDAAAGTASLRFNAPVEFGNRHGTVHGGMISAMLDSATSCAVLAGLPPERTSLTMRLETRFLKPAALGTLSAAAQVVERDDRRALVEAQLFDGGGVHVASAVGEFRLRDRRR